MVDIKDSDNSKRVRSSKAEKQASSIEQYRKKTHETLERFISRKNAKTRDTRMAARKEFVIEYVNTLEQYFKDIAQKIYEADTILQKMQDIRDTKDNDVINKTELGHAVEDDVFLIWLQTRQDLIAIERNMSWLLGLCVSFLTEVGKHSIEFTETKNRTAFEEWFDIKMKSNYFILKHYFPGWGSNVSKLFKLRARYSIQNKARINLGIMKLGELFRNADAFVFAANDYIGKKLEEKYTTPRTYTVADVPEGSSDPQAHMAQQYIVKKKKIFQHQGITIRVMKRQGKYYVSEWRFGDQSLSGMPTESPIARISPIKGKKDQWQLAWMMRDIKWHSLGDDYQGSFQRCLELIIEDPDGFFWG
jgi:hypothetical protein